MEDWHFLFYHSIKWYRVSVLMTSLPARYSCQRFSLPYEQLSFDFDIYTQIVFVTVGRDVCGFLHAECCFSTYLCSLLCKVLVLWRSWSDHPHRVSGVLSSLSLSCLFSIFQKQSTHKTPNAIIKERKKSMNNWWAPSQSWWCYGRAAVGDVSVLSNLVTRSFWSLSTMTLLTFSGIPLGDLMAFCGLIRPVSPICSFCICLGLSSSSLLTPKLHPQRGWNRDPYVVLEETLPPTPLYPCIILSVVYLSLASSSRQFEPGVSNISEVKSCRSSHQTPWLMIYALCVRAPIYNNTRPLCDPSL